ncbi:MAG: winged helix-turn-helix transcriptional regulator [Hyphomicrobium sp.]
MNIRLEIQAVAVKRLMPSTDSKTVNLLGTAEDSDITLGVLAAIEADSAISQRALSSELGVALGLANAYLKRCVRKGLIKIHQVPRRRYTYYLTPKGFAEKARLTGEYLSYSLQFFRRARLRLDELMVRCSALGLRRIALAGASEIAEIATLTAHDHDVEIVAVIDPDLPHSRFCGLPVVRRLKDVDGGIDAVIVTCTKDTDQLVAALTASLGKGKVLVPAFVNVSQIRKPRRKSGNGVSADSVSGKDP